MLFNFQSLSERPIVCFFLKDLVWGSQNRSLVGETREDLPSTTDHNSQKLELFFRRNTK